MIGVLLIAKRIFKNCFSNRMQYHLWFLLLGLLSVPFLPFHFIGFPQLFSWIGNLRNDQTPDIETPIFSTGDTIATQSSDWMNDFTLSVKSNTPSSIGYILFFLWIVGIFAMIILVIKSALRLHTLKKSALPLQSPEVRRLYKHCLEEMTITRNIPVYSTVFLSSPIIVGLFKPAIYLPTHLISDYRETDMRYILLHELQHYKHKDALINYISNFAGAIYWFNPVVWYALKEMRNDREIACDTSVLDMIGENNYENYGNTLINFVEKISLSPFLFAANLSGNMKQMKRRIINIASYETPTFGKRIKGMTAFILTTMLIVGLTPFLSTYAAVDNLYHWEHDSKNISYMDFSSYFGKYEGSFVLYDLSSNQWTIYNPKQAATRVSPDSTYKIYSALFGLTENIITPNNTYMEWDHTDYPFDAWESDQNLASAMASSVNWYFQSIDAQVGEDVLADHLNKLNYGNQMISKNLDSFWLESSLKISPIEQVELLARLYNNELPFAIDAMNTVKDSIHIASTKNGELYGKTGTGRVNGKDINGWFIGYIISEEHTYVFATNIQSDYDANGTNASDITFSILSESNIYQ